MPRPTDTDEGGWVRAASIGVMVLAAALPLSTLVYFGFYSGGYYATYVKSGWEVPAAWVLTAGFVPLHLRHLAAGLRDEAPVHGAWTFALMLALVVTGEVVVGHVWTPMFASLAASALLVFRPPWSVLWAVAITAACYPLGTGVFGVGGWYVVVVGGFRSVTLFGMVWLVAGVRRLHRARRLLAERATARERARVDAELLVSLRAELDRIESGARLAAGALASGDVASSRQVLTRVTDDSRAVLAHARAVVADFRAPSSREELRAAARLLAPGVDAEQRA